MEISKLLNEKLMELNLVATDKNDVINELIEKLDKNNLLTNKKEYANEVFKREETFSTGIGMGIAIPHGKSDAVKKASIVFGKSKQGVNFGSIDGKPAYIIFLIAVPNNANDAHLKVLSQLSRKLMHQEIRELLMEAKTPSEVINIFKGRN